MSTTSQPLSQNAALLDDATRVGAVELAVGSLDRSLDFYTRVIGLKVRERAEDFAALGAGGEDLVTLYAGAQAPPAGPHAGLYHYALLFGTREELARAGRRIAVSGTPIDGASDHGTHEAIYLPDPDGIGIELAADRPRELWPEIRGGAMFAGGGPRPLDTGSLFATIAGEAAPGADEAGAAAPGLQMGHIHLHVGDLAGATRFYRDGLGFEVMASLPTAAFLSAGGYHHHLAFNVWRGGGVGPAPGGAIGLRHWTLQTASAAELEAVRERLVSLGVAVQARDDGGDGGGFLARDPFGIAVVVR